MIKLVQPETKSPFQTKSTIFPTLLWVHLPSWASLSHFSHIYNIKMYRNTYLELYKSSASHQQDPTILLTHFSQIYNTLGCVLQDLEYHIGRLQLQNSKLAVAEEPHKENEHSNAVRMPRPKKPEKEIIKIQEHSQDQPMKRPSGNDKQTRENINNNKKSQYTEEAVKQESYQPRLEIIKPPRATDKSSRQSDHGRMGTYNIPQKARTGSGRPSNSFDELFGGVTEQRGGNSGVKHQQTNLAPVPQHSSENQQSQPPNTYDDFMDRIFKETESRRGK